MTVSSENNRDDYVGNDSATDFTVNWRFLENSHVQVILVVDATGVETIQTETTHYTLTGAGGSSGTVSMITPPATGESLVIKRNVPITQETDYVENDEFPSDSHENALDKLTMITQEFREILDRSFTLNVGDTSGASLILPGPEALKFWRWNAAGVAIELVAISDLGAAVTTAFTRTLLEDADSNEFLTTLEYNSTETGFTARAVRTKLEDIVSLKDFGATGDGVTDDTTGVTSADGAGVDHIYQPDGIYDTTIASNAFNKIYWGEGQIRDTSNNLRGKFFSSANAPPATSGTDTSIETAFNGDLSQSFFQIEHRITGATTLGQPTTGYNYTPEVYPVHTYLFNNSGHNNATATNVGRTAAVAHRVQVVNQGQGDAVCFNAIAHVNATKSGSTSFLANPAGVLFNGQVTAGQAGVYLNPFEILLDDQGFDVAGIGCVVRLDRSVGTGAKDAWWAGFRAQEEGSVNPDAAFSAQGGWDRGLDFGPVTFSADKAAICMKANDRIYGNATASDGRFSDTFNTDYITFSSGLAAWNFVVGNQSAFQIYTNQVVATQPIKADQGYRDNNGNQVMGTRVTGWGAPTGSATRTTFVTSTVTLVELAERVKALIDDLTTHGMIGT